MQNPLNVIKRFQKTISVLKEKNLELHNNFREACRGESAYREALVEERERSKELYSKLQYLEKRLDLEQRRHREKERKFDARLREAYNFRGR